MRLAIYYAPGPGERLAEAGAAWLGRDAFTGRTCEPIVAEASLRSASRYGFHATIRAPFHPSQGVDPQAVDAALAEFCEAREPVTIGRLALRRLGSFLALVPETSNGELSALQRDVLHAFEPGRRPLEPDEIARRRPDRLTERQRRHLADWGYPFVLEDFRFHMTLTDALDDAELDRIEEFARHHFSDFIGEPLTIDRLALFEEAEQGAPFTARIPHRFGGN